LDWFDRVARTVQCYGVDGPQIISKQSQLSNWFRVDLPFAFFVGANGRYLTRFAVCMFAFSFYVFSFRIG